MSCSTPSPYISSCHHSDRGWSWFNLSNECFSSTVQAVLDVHLVGFCEWVFLQHGNDSAITHHCCLWRPGLFVLLTSSVLSFLLRIYQTVDFAILNISQMDFFSVFAALGCLIPPSCRALFNTCFLFIAKSSKCKHHTSSQLRAFYLLNW